MATHIKLSCTGGGGGGWGGGAVRVTGVFASMSALRLGREHCLVRTPPEHLLPALNIWSARKCRCHAATNSRTASEPLHACAPFARCQACGLLPWQRAAHACLHHERNAMNTVCMSPMQRGREESRGHVCGCLEGAPWETRTHALPPTHIGEGVMCVVVSVLVPECARR